MSILVFQLEKCKIEAKNSNFNCQQIWEEILELCQPASHLEAEKAMLEVLRLIKNSKPGWRFKVNKHSFLSAFGGSGECNCSCGVTMLICLAESWNMLGQLGEAKWEAHTTLASKRPDQSIWILETTNRIPNWRPMETIERCNYTVEFNPKKLFLYNMVDMVRNSNSRRRNQFIVQCCFKTLPEEFWLRSGGDIAWLCWIWATRTDSFRTRVVDLCLQAIELSQLNRLLCYRLARMLELSCKSKLISKKINRWKLSKSKNMTCVNQQLSERWTKQIGSIETSESGPIDSGLLTVANSFVRILCNQYGLVEPDLCVLDFSIVLDWTTDDVVVTIKKHDNQIMMYLNSEKLIATYPLTQPLDSISHRFAENIIDYFKD